MATEQKARAACRHRDETALDRKIANLVDAISDGRPSAAILAKLSELVAQRDQMGVRVADALSIPALHHGIADTYATHVPS